MTNLVGECRVEIVGEEASYRHPRRDRDDTVELECHCRGDTCKKGDNGIYGACNNEKRNGQGSLKSEGEEDSRRWPHGMRNQLCPSSWHMSCL